MQRTFQFGDRVRHPKRPEWGIGSVVKAEEISANGRRTQRLAIRFPNVGLKTISTAHADLQPVEEEDHVTTNGEGPAAAVQAWDRMRSAEWLGDHAEKKMQQAMTELPMEARDPFRSLEDRLAFTLRLYRFDRSGRGLIDWAVAQTGMRDPLTRFARQELEQIYDRWRHELDTYLGRLLSEAKDAGVNARPLLDDAPPAARQAVSRQRVGR